MNMEIRKANSLTKKLKGYQKAHKDRFYLLALDRMTMEEFILYELFIAITDWDRRHFDTYGTFKATNREIREVLRWKADSTVSRHKKSLMEKGFLETLGERLKVKDFESWELKKGSA
jgi:hypothetical protein